MRVLRVRGAGEGRLKQRRVRPTTTSCVVAWLRFFRSGRRQGSALRIRSRSAGSRGRWEAAEEAESRDDGTGLHEEGPHRLLEGGDRTVGVGEGGLEMCEDLRRRRPWRG